MSRHDDAFDIRVEAAKLAKNRNTDNHMDNGEEDKYRDANGNRNFIANYTKGLKHHPKDHQDAGEVKNPDYKKLLDAVKSGKPGDFEQIPLGFPSDMHEKFTSPQGGFTFDLEGPDSADFAMRKAPRIDGAEAAGEMAELYWMAICRDVSFVQFDSDSNIGEAVTDLSSNYSDYPHPFAGSSTPVTRASIFRGVTGGDSEGPYISQFLYKPIRWGVQTLEQVQRIAKKEDYLTDYDSWLEAQDGKKVNFAEELEDGSPPPVRHILTGRDLAYWVHYDALYQAYLGALMILLRDENKFDHDLPLQNSKTQKGFVTFGGPHILSLVTEVSTRALKAVWYSKWSVHRRLRPEAFGGLIHRQKNRNSPSPDPILTHPSPDYPINNEILESNVLSKIFAKNNSYLLPMAHKEGSPTHPSYGSGHATVAGACVTILKAWFDEGDNIKGTIFKPKDDGTGIDEASGLTLKVGKELNKVASNVAIGRSWAGVHYRSDNTESILLGEKIALGILQEQALTYHKDEPFKCSLTRFNGQQIRFEGEKIIPSIF